MASDQSEYDDRPAPRKSNSTLWIILAVVGAVLLVSCLGCVVLVPALMLPAVQKVREAAQRTQRMNDMKQVGLAVHNFLNEKNRGPANFNDILPYLVDPKIHERLRSGDIQVIWNVAPLNQQTDGTQNVILAWENRPDSVSGQRLVVYMDGHVDWVPEQQFPQTPKARIAGGKIP